MTTQKLEQTPRTRLRRSHKRGDFDRETINSILDATSLCHVGYLVDGKPAVTPTIHWREGDHVYWHGSSASRALKNSNGHDVCLTVSLLDGMVLARSAMHHSANYRSVMIYGHGTKVTDIDEKKAKLRTFLDQLFPGRWDMLRPMTDQELKATMILGMPIEEASAKVRTGGPIDDEEDYDLRIWAGVLPLVHALQRPVPDPRNRRGVEMPDHVLSFARP